MPDSINMNEDVYVRLTLAGLRILLQSDSGERFYRYNYDRRLMALRAPLWELMEIFGPHHHMGMGETPFDDNVIYFDGSADGLQGEPDLKKPKEGI